MVSVFALWLPILLSAVLVFVASTIIHMVLRYHKSDWKLLPGETTIREAIRAQNVPPGVYMFPWSASMKEAGSPEMQEKFNQGPNGTMVLWKPGPMAMGKGLVQWFFYSVVIGAISGYIAGITLGPGSGYDIVFRVTGTAAILGYSASSLVDSIWKGQPWGVTLKHIFDGVIYGLLTAGTFGWLWPGA